MILEGAMIVLASTALTICHPGLIFRKFWNLDRARADMDGEGENEREGKHGVMLSESRGG